MKASGVEIETKRSFFFYVGLWIHLFKNTLHRAVEYRTNFFGRSFTEVLWISSQILFAYSITGHSSTILGWRSEELLVFFGFMTLLDALFMLFIHDNLREFESLIKNGTFDFHLLRPVNTVFLSTMRFPNAVSLVNLSYSIGIIIYASIKLDVTLSLLTLLAGIIYFLLGFLLVFLLNVFIMSLGFWMTRTNMLVWLFFEFYRLSFRPDDFYFHWLRRILLSIFPAAFFISIPVKIFLGKALESWMWFMPWILLVIGFITVRTMWQKGIKNYEGALS